MKFAGFDRAALDELGRLPSLDAAGYGRHRDAERLSDPLPTHRWLVKHLAMKDTTA